MKFDPEIIETFARRLYGQASRIVIRYGVLFALLGGGFGAAVYYYLPAVAARDFGPVIGGAAVVLFALIGVSIGNDRAFGLRLQAQVALCQVQIERNTRTASEQTRVAHSDAADSLGATHFQPVAPAAVPLRG